VLDPLLAEARDDDNVVGVVLFGSRGKGAFVTERSDWDVFVVVREHRGERPFVHCAALETVEVTLDELRNQPAWNRYSLTWLEPQLDKTGEVAAALRNAVRVDPATAGEPLDGHVNSYYRSAKNARVGLELASLLDAQESVGWFLQFVFAVHGRIRPYNKWLAWELQTHPLLVERPPAARADSPHGRHRRAAGALPGCGVARPEPRTRQRHRRLGAGRRLASRRRGRCLTQRRIEVSDTKPASWCQTPKGARVPLVEELVVVHVHLLEHFLLARIDDGQSPVVAGIRAHRAEVAPDAHHRELLAVAERLAGVVGKETLGLRQLRNRQLPHELLHVRLLPRLHAGAEDSNDRRHVSAES
jgi:hypothetical protein